MDQSRQKGGSMNLRWVVSKEKGVRVQGENVLVISGAMYDMMREV